MTARTIFTIAALGLLAGLADAEVSHIFGTAWAGLAFMPFGMLIGGLVGAATYAKDHERSSR